MKRYYKTANSYFQERFGFKVYKIALDGGMSCPNRDGTVSFGGCVFCGVAGAGDFCAEKTLSITQQVNVQKERLQTKWKDLKIIPYFQSFLSTVPYICRLSF